RTADRACGDDVFPSPDLHGGTAHDDGETVPEQKTENNRHDQKGAAIERDGRKSDQHDRHAEPGGDDEADDGVDTPAEESGGKAERYAYEGRNRDRENPDEKRGRRAVHEAAQIVAADLVGAEGMRPTGPLVAV